ncbi:MAG: efflux transporter outer membrane subunit [Mariprofundaceae bacterium]|nr:efflux transporter outer membrane subunit [Mariprofundaceae bacterium]
MRIRYETGRFSHCRCVCSSERLPLGPDYHRPDFHAQDSGQWQSQLSTTAGMQAVEAADWWKQLNDPLLSELIAGALQENRDLGVALANIERARALRRVAGSAFYPTLDASGSAGRSKFSRQSNIVTSSGTRNTFAASLDASGELDLFGRTRRAVEAADARIQAEIEVHRGLMLSVVAELTSNYFEARGLQRQFAVTEQDIGLLREVEEIARAQSELGVTTDLELTRAIGERESFEATLPNLGAEIAARIYRISVLTGQSPEFHMQALQQSSPLPMPPDAVPVGLRSDILQRRPDVQLAAATAGIGVAKADLFPSFSLTGAVGSNARVFSDLFTPLTLTRSIGGVLGWPVFAAGSITPGVDVAEADAKAALAAYEQSVLLALEDGEASLMRYGKQWQTLKRLKKAEATHQQAFEIARLRYETGDENFLVILDAERALIATRNDIISSETKILTSLAQLYKALGGGWAAAASQ